LAEAKYLDFASIGFEFLSFDLDSPSSGLESASIALGKAGTLAAPRL
jgi:hypothetical protein